MKDRELEMFGAYYYLKTLSRAPFIKRIYIDVRIQWIRVVAIPSRGYLFPNRSSIISASYCIFS